MASAKEAELGQADRAALFWVRFWEDRSVDFTEPAVTSLGSTHHIA